MSLAKFRFASTEILSQYSKQLNAMSMISWLSSRCCDFSLVKMTMNDLMSASLSSLFDFSASIYSAVLAIPFGSLCLNKAVACLWKPS